MADLETVCCMCGDVGFPDKLFRCNKCLNRFQHSYCSNYYGEYVEPIQVCDWCRSEERRSATRKSSSSKKSYPSEYSSGERIKQQDRQENHSAAEVADKGKSGGAPCPRTATRRYKLLKDVMC